MEDEKEEGRGKGLERRSDLFGFMTGLDVRPWTGLGGFPFPLRDEWVKSCVGIMMGEAGGMEKAGAHVDKTLPFCWGFPCV